MLRVNLLKEKEIRYYSAVSRDFAIKAGIISGVLILTLFSVLFIFQVMSVQSNLSQLQEEWEEIEPRYERFLALEGGLETNKTLLAELNQWQEMGQEWSDPMRILQRYVPPEVQLNSMKIRSAFSVDVDRKTIGEEEEAVEIVRVTPSRRYQLSLQGRAFDELADEIVVRFVRDLKADPALSEIFKTVRLLGLRRGANEESNERVFSIDIEGIEMEGSAK